MTRELAHDVGSWAKRLKPNARAVLVYMASQAMDGNGPDDRLYFRGLAPIAVLLGGTDADGIPTRNGINQASRIVAQLVSAGAVIRRGWSPKRKTHTFEVVPNPYEARHVEN